MRALLLLLSIALLVWLWFATDGFEHAPFDTAPPPAAPDPGLLGSEGSASPAGLKGRKKATPVGDGQDTLPPGVDLRAAAARGDIHGRILDGKGHPLGGATVQLVHYPWQRAGVLASERYYDEVLGAKARTARDGTFALPGRTGVQVSLRAGATGFATAERRGLEGGQFVELRLGPGATLDILTVGPDGAPLEGVALELRMGPRETSGLRRVGTTGADGHCVFEGLPAMRFDVGANHGTLGGHAWTRDGKTLEAGKTRTHKMTLPTGRIVRGVVRDAETRQPVQGARVGMGWTFHKTAMTDEEGRYALGGWTGNYYHDMHVLAAGYARAEITVGDARTIDFALKRACSVRGRTVDRSGAPLADVLMSCVGTDYSEALGQTISTAHGRSAADGSFVLNDLRPGMVHTVIAMKAGHGRHLTEFVTPGPGEVFEVGDIVMPAGLAFRGLVVEADGTPRAACAVRLQGANADARRLRDADAPVLDDHYGRWEETTADASGRFAFGDLAPGTYLLQAGEDGDYAPGIITLRTGETPPVVRLTFPRAQVFVVHVVDDKGKPVAGQYVGIEPQGAEDVYEETDATGRVTFRIPSHCSSAFVQVYFDASESDTPYLAPDGTTVSLRDGSHKITLLRAAIISGHLLDPAGKGIPRANILVRRGAEPVTSALTGADGAFEALVPPEGVYELWFRGGAYRRQPSGSSALVRLPLEARARDVAAGSTGIKLQARAIPSDGSLHVRVRGPDGKPVAGAKVSIRPAPVSKEASGVTDADGAVSLTGMTAHPLLVTVHPPTARATDMAPREIDDVIPDGRTLQVELLVPLEIEGRVLDAEGQPAVGVDVYVSEDVLGSRAARKTDGDGRFRAALPPDLEDSISIRAMLRDKEGRFFYAEVSGIDPRGEPPTLQLKRRLGW